MVGSNEWLVRNRTVEWLAQLSRLCQFIDMTMDGLAASWAGPVKIYPLPHAAIWQSRRYVRNRTIGTTEMGLRPLVVICAVLSVLAALTLSGATRGPMSPASVVAMVAAH